MKTIRYIWTLCLAFTALAFTACSDDDNDSQSTPMTINKIFLEDVKSSVPDREVTFARLGQLLRIEGTGFSGLKKIYVNGYDTYFNNALMTDNNVWVTLNGNTPVDKAEADVRNTIVLVKDGTQLTYEFTIRAAAPSVSYVDNTLPKAGEIVTVYGRNLQETSKITLPGGVEVTENIYNDEDGEFYAFYMPAGVTESGSIVSEGANGMAVTPAYFNFNDCYIIDFDGKGVQGGWSATYSSEDLVSDPLGTGRGNVVMLIPQSRLDEGGVNAGISSIPGWWTAGNDEPTDDWNRMTSFIPSDTQLGEIALQFDVYVPEEWSGSGQMEITLQNNLSSYGYGSTETTFTTNIQYPTATVWVPWLVDGKVVPYTTGNRWITVTIPLTQFGKYSDEGGSHTFAEVIADRNAGSYRNFGFLFCNPDLKYSDDLVFESSKFDQKIYVDNFRIVPNTSITVSDFDD